MSAVKLISGNVSGWCGCDWFEFRCVRQKKQPSGLTIIQDGAQSNKWSQHLLLTAVSARAAFVPSSAGRPLLFCVQQFRSCAAFREQGGDILFLQWDLLGVWSRPVSKQHNPDTAYFGRLNENVHITNICDKTLKEDLRVTALWHCSQGFQKLNPSLKICQLTYVRKVSGVLCANTWRGQTLNPTHIL